MTTKKTPKGRVSGRKRDVEAKASRKPAKKAALVKLKAKKEAAEAVVKKEQESRGRLKEILSDSLFTGYVSRTIGTGVEEMLDLLSAGPQIDEKISEKLGMKINEARRMLNALNGYGIVRYEVNKDKKGWLTFKWHIDHKAIVEFYKELGVNRSNNKGKLPDNCNDFFICNACYKTQKVIFPFEAAFEAEFKCECGKDMEMLDRSEALAFLNA